MALTKLITLLFTSIALVLSFSSADFSPSKPISASSLCNYTLYPLFCKSVLPNRPSFNLYDYGRTSIKISLSYARNLLSLIHNYLSRSSYLTFPTLAALQDCKFLSELNLELLSNSFQIVNSSFGVLSYDQAQDAQTLLSAIITNIDTCLDSIQETNSALSLKDGLLTPLSNNIRLYSVALALFTKGWVPKNKLKAQPPASHKNLLLNGKLNLRMSKEHHPIFETETGLRKLLQTGTNGSDVVIVSDVVTVGQDGSSNFTNINDAIAAAPDNTKDGFYYLIFIKAGVYEEYVSIASNKKYLMMIGDGINQTVITGNHSVVDGWTTFNSSTFAVAAKGFVAVNITFQNTAGPIKHQSVAVRNSADLSAFYNCSFEGYQDTLYVHSLRQFYKDCDIYGTIDFIFGNSASVLQNCNIYPRLPMIGQFNVITAQGRTDVNQNTGITTQNCVIRAAADLASSNRTVQTYLGRPWKEYSRTVYMQCFMDSLINLSGWHIWDGEFALNTSYYAEFNNSGPGSNTSRRVNWVGFHTINATDAATFTVSNFLLGDNWLPQTGVPYFGS